ncbi:hypothetical protein FAI41_01300 [Acetobacteraceae bacterium]|nr:hypothetical protein FAI41_01300 [Acetobacteraceae bacterium]
MPNPYVVPGGRFLEGYYWNIHFIMLALRLSDQGKLADGMLDNFVYQIETYGYIPNAKHSYYLFIFHVPKHHFLL